MGYRPENTLPSFELALEQGADCVEFDVHLTRDGHLVVIHDDTLDRTSNGHGLVREHTLAEIDQLDAGVPTLDAVLQWAHQTGMAVDIEIKNGPHFYQGIEEKVVDAVQRADVVDQTLVSSFDHRAVQRVGELDPRVAVGVLYAARPADGGVKLAELVNAQVVLPHVAYANADDVARAHGAGLAYIPWTTSDPQVIRELIDAGVDGICSNHPDVVRGALTAAPAVTAQ